MIGIFRYMSPCSAPLGNLPTSGQMDPVPADAEPVVPAPVEPLRRIRVIGQGGDSHADLAHAVLVAQVMAG
jgi:hypothetical protein